MCIYEKIKKAEFDLKSFKPNFYRSNHLNHWQSFVPTLFSKILINPNNSGDNYGNLECTG